jgi:aspartate/methionine/tyrosine aminotransferase
VPVLVPTRAEDGFALKAEAVAARITPRTRTLLFASPAAPAGGVTTGADLAALADLAQAYDLQVIWDETFRDYLFDGVEQQHLATLPGMWERTVVVGSFSTRYAMSGWRAGYVLGSARLLRPVALMKQSLTICSPAPSQWAALAALTGPQDAVGQAVREVAGRRTVALRALTALGLSCGGGAGTPYLFIDLREIGADGRAFAAAALREAAVRLLPGEEFGPGGAGFVRLTLGAPAPVLERAIRRLAPVVARLRGELGQKGGQ